MKTCLLLPFAPFLAGCLACAYPSICETPELRIDGEEVRAYRMITDVGQCGGVIAGCITISHDTEEIHPTDNVVPAQGDWSITSYYLAFPFAGGHRRSMEMRLYRPGYRTVVVPAQACWYTRWWREPEAVAWIPAADLPAQEEALDKLAGGQPFGSGTRNKDFARYVASEYERLAASPLADAAARERLLGRAKDFRSGTE